MSTSSTTSPTKDTKDSVPAIYKTLFFVTAPLTLILAGTSVWMGVRLTSVPSSTPEAAASAASTSTPAQPTPRETAAPDQTNATNLQIMASFVRANPQDPQAKGSSDAPVTLVLFSDFACPYCTRFAQEVEPSLNDLIEGGVVRIEWHDLAQITPTSPLAAQAGIAAGMQGKFWEFHDVVYGAADPSGHPQYSEDSLTDFARSAGVPDLEKFRADMTSADTQAAVATETERAHQAGITGTPMMFVNNAVINGYRDADYVRATILDQAAKAGR